MRSSKSGRAQPLSPSHALAGARAVCCACCGRPIPCQGPGAAQSTKKFPPASCSTLVSERRNRSCSIRHSGSGLFVALHCGHRASGRGLDWVKTGKAQNEQMLSGLPPIPDIARRGWHGRKVPKADSCTAAKMRAIRSPRRRVRVDCQRY